MYTCNYESCSGQKLGLTRIMTTCVFLFTVFSFGLPFGVNWLVTLLVLFLLCSTLDSSRKCLGINLNTRKIFSHNLYKLTLFCASWSFIFCHLNSKLKKSWLWKLIYFSPNSDIVRKIDQSEFEGFEYINPLLMSAEECVWSSFHSYAFCLCYHLMHGKVNTSLDTMNHLLFATYEKALQCALLLTIRVNYYI